MYQSITAILLNKLVNILGRRLVNIVGRWVSIVDVVGVAVGKVGNTVLVQSVCRCGAELAAVDLKDGRQAHRSVRMT